MGLIKLIALAVGGLVLLVGGAAGVAYAVDATLEATVIGKDCKIAGDSSVEVETKVGNIRHEVVLPYQQCQALQKGNFVEYKIRSERTTLYQKEGGTCIYDTEAGAGC